MHVINRLLFPPEHTLEHILNRNKRLRLFYKTLQDKQLLQTLQGNQTITVFAPTNAAMEKFFEENPDITDEQFLNVLNRHFVSNGHYQVGFQPGEVSTLQTLEIVEGTPSELRMRVQNAGGALEFLDYEAKVARVYIGATNGVLYMINKVLVKK